MKALAKPRPTGKVSFDSAAAPPNLELARVVVDVDAFEGLALLVRDAVSTAKVRLLYGFRTAAIRFGTVSFGPV